MQNVQPFDILLGCECSFPLSRDISKGTNCFIVFMIDTLKGLSRIYFQSKRLLKINFRAKNRFQMTFGFCVMSSLRFDGASAPLVVAGE